MEPGSPVSDVSLHWWPRRDPWTPATIGPLCDDLSHRLPYPCLPRFHSTPCRFCSSSQRSDRFKSRCQVAVETLQLHFNEQSYWSSGSTVCFQPRGAPVHVPLMYPHLQWNQVLLSAMSRYNISIRKMELYTCCHINIYWNGKQNYIYAAISKEKWKRKLRRFALIGWPFAHCANGSLSFVNLLTKKQVEVIRLQTDWPIFAWIQQWNIVFASDFFLKNCLFVSGLFFNLSYLCVISFKTCQWTRLVGYTKVYFVLSQ
jgi:hypothetical protein